MEHSVANLDTVTRDDMLRKGLMFFAGTLLVSGAMLQLQVHWAWRGILVFPFFLAVHAIHGALLGICTFSASNGVRQTSQGEEPIACKHSCRELKKKGSKVLMGSLSLATMATALVMLAARLEQHGFPEAETAPLLLPGGRRWTFERRGQDETQDLAPALPTVHRPQGPAQGKRTVAGGAINPRWGPPLRHALCPRQP